MFKLCSSSVQALPKLCSSSVQAITKLCSSPKTKECFYHFAGIFICLVWKVLAPGPLEEGECDILRNVHGMRGSVITTLFVIFQILAIIISGARRPSSHYQQQH